METFFILAMGLVNINYYLTIARPFILMFLKLFNIHLYEIRNHEKVVLIESQFENCICSDYMNDRPSGIIIPRHMKFIAYMSNMSINHIIILTSKKWMKKINEQENKETKIEKIEINTENNNDTIAYWERSGDYTFFEYSKRNIYIRNRNFTKEQNQIYENIMEIYNKKNIVKCFIHGKPGCGKTFISYLMALELNCHLCDTFNPAEPSDFFSNIYYRVRPTSKKPLILLLDEIDILFKNVTNETIVKHQKSPTQVFNKLTWNHFIDKIDYGMYPNLIFILCSNRTTYDINKMDPCFLREGRVDLIQHLIKNI